jgi:hypothetical protein
MPFRHRRPCLDDYARLNSQLRRDFNRRDIQGTARGHFYCSCQRVSPQCQFDQGGIFNLSTWNKCSALNAGLNGNGFWLINLVFESNIIWIEFEQ